MKKLLTLLSVISVCTYLQAQSKVTIKGYENMADDEEDKMVGMTKEEFKAAIQKETDGAVTCK